MKKRYRSPQVPQSVRSLQIYSRSQFQSAVSMNKCFLKRKPQQRSHMKIGAFTFDRSKVIGQGYSSTVHVATKDNDQTLYALKAIKIINQSKSHSEMLHNEISILRSLSHPNILKFEDVIFTRTHCYIVTEYCPEGDLKAVVAKSRRFGEKEVLRVTSQLIEGYQYLVAKGIIHRDLKPANILKSGNLWKIADFGFSIRGNGSHQTLYNVGTPLYMSPESLARNIYSVKSDIFSIGIILFELIFRHTPWECRTEKELYRNMKLQGFTIPYSYGRQTLPDKLYDLLLSMCDVDFDQRMTCSDFLALDPKSLSTEPFRNQQLVKSPRGKSRACMLHRKIRSEKDTQTLSLLKSTLSCETLADTQQQEPQQHWIKNHHILINQLHYCRFLYSLIRNRRYVLLDADRAHVLNLIVFRHLVSLIRQLSDCQNNFLKLEDWSNFTKTKKYMRTNLTIKQYELRYLNEYKTFVKDISSRALQNASQEIDQINQTSPSFSEKYYKQVSKFIIKCLKVFDFRLGCVLKEMEGSAKQQQVGQLQFLSNLYKLYELLELGRINSQRYVYFEAFSTIQVHFDFKSSQIALGDYSRLSELIGQI